MPLLVGDLTPDAQESPTTGGRPVYAIAAGTTNLLLVVTMVELGIVVAVVLMDLYYLGRRVTDSAISRPGLLVDPRCR